MRSGNRGKGERVKWKWKSQSAVSSRQSAVSNQQSVSVSPAVCLLLLPPAFNKFAEIPGVAFSEPIPIDLTKKRHNLIAVF